MANRKIEVGDIVNLKSQSPPMVVVKVSNDKVKDSEDIISCFYWNNIKGEFSTQDFLAYMLKLSKE
ncbi:MAG TPA: hypothetical protein VN698_05870 [Bacteroidia bacterium]|nr:hypothetical protein [Bacteroidia bacterium]